ncbi:type II secretion system minor pseudopilin GspI [Acinetobacter sp. Marseille-Q1618]|uniref:type II secretion system minor pseudopilin GspI n=1 Tax=Acinetobacter sp. Marseille-Q1618 TaxID=2697502 RepID=UPI00156D6489|nr:type II secretion system minor pseudopilin GspI [Acinetobacter sp. Marseille-Q1618]
MKSKYWLNISPASSQVKTDTVHSQCLNTAFARVESSENTFKHSKRSFSFCARAKCYFAIPRSSSTAFGLATRSSSTRLNRVSGFTLIEVVVALAIFAVAAMALTKVAMQYTQSTANSILRTKAQFVAQNQVALMEINNEQLTGTQSEQITSQGETWQVDKKAEATISPDIKKIDIQISLYNPETNKVEAGITNAVFFNYPQKNVQS